MPPKHCSLALALPLLLAGCGGAASDEDGDVTAAGSGGNHVVLGSNDGSDDGLGSANLARPDWLPGDFPLPRDAHIFITVDQANQKTPIFMIQARTRADGEEICDAVVAWAKGRGLNAERLKSHSDMLHLASFNKGNGLDSASLQVHDKDDGVNTIILAVERSPW